MFLQTLYSQLFWSEGWRPPGAQSEQGELSQWLCHDDSTIDIVVIIIVIFKLTLEKKKKEKNKSVFNLN